MADPAHTLRHSCTTHARIAAASAAALDVEYIIMQLHYARHLVYLGFNCIIPDAEPIMNYIMQWRLKKIFFVYCLF